MSDIFSQFSSGFISILSGKAFLWMLIGILLGLIVGFIPGLGGNFILSLLIPMSVGMDMISAFALLIGANSVTDAGGSVSAVLLNIPGTGKNVATTFDGFPLTKQGKAGFALGSALTASMLGGLIGGIFLMFAIMLVRPVVLKFGPAEMFALTLLGIIFISGLTGERVTKGLLMGLVGLLLSLVGDNPATGTIRFSSDIIYLWDGLPLIPVILGLFAVTEMIFLGIKGGSITEVAYVPKLISRGLLEGFLYVFRKSWISIRSSLIGIIAGVLPGLGGQAAAFFSYSYAAKTSKDPKSFGTGNVEGVIAAEAAASAEQGGALVTTLAFGIPGNTSSALLLGVFVLFGIAPGPDMLGTKLSLTFSIAWIFFLANAVGTLIALPCCGLLARLSHLKGSLVVPLILTFALIGSFTSSFDLGDIILTIIFGIAGYWMRKYKYPMAPLVLGLVLGSMAERNMQLAYNLFGLNFLVRPIVLVILFCGLLIILWPVIVPNKSEEKSATH